MRFLFIKRSMAVREGGQSGLDPNDLFQTSRYLLVGNDQLRDVVIDVFAKLEVGIGDGNFTNICIGCLNGEFESLEKLEDVNFVMSFIGLASFLERTYMQQYTRDNDKLSHFLAQFFKDLQVFLAQTPAVCSVLMVLSSKLTVAVPPWRDDSSRAGEEDSGHSGRMDKYPLATASYDLLTRDVGPIRDAVSAVAKSKERIVPDTVLKRAVTLACIDRDASGGNEFYADPRHIPFAGGLEFFATDSYFSEGMESYKDAVLLACRVCELAIGNTHVPDKLFPDNDIAPYEECYHTVPKIGIIYVERILEDIRKKEAPNRLTDPDHLKAVLRATKALHDGWQRHYSAHNHPARFMIKAAHGLMEVLTCEIDRLNPVHHNIPADFLRLSSKSSGDDLRQTAADSKLTASSIGIDRADRDFDLTCALTGEVYHVQRGFEERGAGLIASVYKRTVTMPDGSQRQVAARAMHSNFADRYLRNPSTGERLNGLHNLLVEQFPPHGMIPVELCRSGAELPDRITNYMTEKYIKPEALLFIRDPHTKACLRQRMHDMPGADESTIPLVYAYVPSEGIILEELCEGLPLGGQLGGLHTDHFKDFTFEAAVNVLRQVAFGFRAALDLGMLLPDTLANDIFVVADGSVRLIDLNVLSPLNHPDLEKKARYIHHTTRNVLAFSSLFALRCAATTPDDDGRDRLLRIVAGLDQIAGFRREGFHDATTISEQHSRLEILESLLSYLTSLTSFSHQ